MWAQRPFSIPQVNAQNERQEEKRMEEGYLKKKKKREEETVMKDKGFFGRHTTKGFNIGKC